MRTEVRQLGGSGQEERAVRKLGNQARRKRQIGS